MKNLNPQGASISAKKMAIKAAILAAIALVLLIPLSMIESLTHERMQRQKEVDQSIANNLSQNVALNFFVEFQTLSKTLGKTPYEVDLDSLDVDADLVHKYIHQGRFDVLTYNATVKYRATVSLAEQVKNLTKGETLDSASVKLVIKTEDYDNYKKTVFKKMPLVLDTALYGAITGDFTIGGLESFAIFPQNNTKMTLTGDWPNPDFASPGILPSERQVTANGFAATWKQSGTNVNGANMGVKLLVPVPQYQMTIRTIKYGILIIVLTFAMFFIAELWTKRSINIVQYLLPGLALVIFYSLLLSISEYTRFSYAYLIAAVMTIGLVLIYLVSVLGNKKTAAIICSFLAILYLYIYILTQLETYSLISGSIGFFIILAMIMYASQRVFKTRVEPNDTTPEAVN